MADVEIVPGEGVDESLFLEMDGGFRRSSCFSTMSIVCVLGICLKLELMLFLNYRYVFFIVDHWPTLISQLEEKCARSQLSFI